MQAFAIRSHGCHTYDQTVAQPGAQYDDPCSVEYAAKSQITVEQLPVSCVISLNESMFSNTATAYIAPLKWHVAYKVLKALGHDLRPNCY